MSGATITLTESADGGVEVQVDFGVPANEPFPLTPAHAMALLMLQYFRECERRGGVPMPLAANLPKPKLN